MFRARYGAIVIATLFACQRDSGPTSPGVSSNSVSSAGPGLFAERQGDSEDDARGPHESNVRGLVTFTSVRGHFRGCQGADGYYIENHPNLFGTVTGDSRLTGTIEINAIEVVRFGDDGNISSPSVGPFRISDASGRIKVEGQYAAWFANDGQLGSLVGHAADAGGALGGLLIAGFRYNNFENGGLTLQIGGFHPANELTAGVWAGKCTGKWTDYSGDVPAPTAGTASALRTSTARPAYLRYLPL